jgi:uncharacterized SAM-binding protein YcdF (DUF218 family)
MRKKKTGDNAGITVQWADTKTVGRANGIKGKINRMLVAIWLVTAILSLFYFIFQSIRGVMLNPSMIFMGGLGFSMLILYVLSKIFNDAAAKFYSTPVFAVLKYVYIAFIALFLVISVMIIACRGDGIYQKTDYLIVLGAKVNQDSISLSLANRLDMALDYLKIYPDVTIILSGGMGDDEPMAEAVAMEQYLASHGVDKAKTKIILEDRSRSTYENLFFSAEIIYGLEAAKTANKTELANAKEAPPDGANGAIAVSIVTSDYHMLRVRMLAERAGLRAAPIPAETPFFTLPSLFLREVFAVVKSFIMDR